jgi:cobalamin biosynthesis protein CobT
LRRPDRAAYREPGRPFAPISEGPDMSTVDVKPTNRKPAAKADAPNEPFKRALASCTRALARHPELEIAFSADKPSLVSSPEGTKARLPEPPRKPNPRAD